MPVAVAEREIRFYAVASAEVLMVDIERCRVRDFLASSRPFEVDEVFRDLAEWEQWSAENLEIYDRSVVLSAYHRILARGVEVPLKNAEDGPCAASETTGNFREGLYAKQTISRTRAVLYALERTNSTRSVFSVSIFGAEALTPLAMQLRGLFPKYYGSEFCKDETARRAIFPIPHQDLLDLTFPDSSFDIITTNEVLEHVPDIDLALIEMARVLKPGGWHIGTFPFWHVHRTGDVRARIVDGNLVHMKDPEYHGNPVDTDAGSLVFETPAWDIVERARSAGFSDPTMRFICSERYGILSDYLGVFVFCAQK